MMLEQEVRALVFDFKLGCGGGGGAQELARRGDPGQLEDDCNSPQEGRRTCYGQGRGGNGRGEGEKEGQASGFSATA